VEGCKGEGQKVKDEDKRKQQLIVELTELRQRIAELEASKAERKQAEENIKRGRQISELKKEKR